MQTKAFIIANNEVIAQVETGLAAGELVSFGFFKVEECMNANRQWNLVNASNGKISRAQKWVKKFVAQAEGRRFGKEINPGEFFIL